MINRNVQSQSSQHQAGRAKPFGFTLTELLVVILIIVLLTVLALPVVLGALSDHRFNDAARTLQAALAGARDRAIVARQVQGLRMVRDERDIWEVSTLMYVGIPEPYTVGTVTVAGMTVTPSPSPGPTAVFDQVDQGQDNVLGTADDIPRVVPNASYIRFDSAGRLYLITAVNTGTPATLTISPTPTSIDTSIPHTYQILRAPVPLPQDAPVKLPDGVVIDLRTPLITLNATPGAPDRELLRLPRSLYAPNQYPRGPFMPWGTDGIWGNADDPPSPAPPPTWPSMDILFGPHGAVIGSAANSPLIHFWIGERGDKGGIGADLIGGTLDDLAPIRPHKLLTLNTRTGAVQTWNEPTPKGTPPFYPEVYGEPEQQLGVSAPLVEDWLR